MRRSLWVLLVGLLVSGCAAATAPERTLRAPSGTIPAAASAMEEGNRLFAARQWEEAKAQYEAAIKAQPSLAEAHYNLAVVIEILGDDATARRHYVEAANLAPGHKIIWDSPPFRRHGIVEPTRKSDDLTTPSSRTAH